MTLKTRPLCKHFGAEVIGVDLSQSVPDPIFNEIMDLYFQHSVLLFRDQDLSPAAQADLTRRFGPPRIPPRKEFNLPDHPEVSRVGNIIDENGKPIAFFNQQGVEWHSDSSGEAEIDGVTFLYAVEVPPQGGETMFCSMVTAYETLPNELRSRIEGQRVLHSFNYHNDKVLRISPEAAKPLSPEERALIPDVWHDLVQVHPVTGKKLYFVSHNLAQTVTGIPEEETEEFVMQLVDHATQPGFVYTHSWRSGDLILWDNRAAMHSATDVDSYRQERRLMHRSFAFTRSQKA